MLAKHMVSPNLPTRGHGFHKNVKSTSLRRQQVHLPFITETVSSVLDTFFFYCPSTIIHRRLRE